MSFTIAAVATTAIGAGTQIVSGIKQTKAGNKLAANNKRPDYIIPDEYKDNVELNASQAMNGLDGDSMNYYTNQANRGLSSGIDAILQAGGNVNTIEGLYDRFDDGNLRTAAQNAQLKTQHIASLIDANKEMAGQKTQAWTLNEYEPYKDTAQLASQQKAAGAANLKNGLSSAGSLLSTLSDMNNDYDDEGNSGPKTFGQKNGAETLENHGIDFSSLPSYGLSDDNPFEGRGSKDYMSELSSTGLDSKEMLKIKRYLQGTTV